MTRFPILDPSHKETNPYLALSVATIGFVVLNLAFGPTAQKWLATTSLASSKSHLSGALLNAVGMIRTFAPIALLCSCMSLKAKEEA